MVKSIAVATAPCPVPTGYQPPFQPHTETHHKLICDDEKLIGVSWGLTSGKFSFYTLLPSSVLVPAPVDWAPRGWSLTRAAPPNPIMTQQNTSCKGCDVTHDRRVPGGRHTESCKFFMQVSLDEIRKGVHVTGAPTGRPYYWFFASSPFSLDFNPFFFNCSIYFLCPPF